MTPTRGRINPWWVLLCVLRLAIYVWLVAGTITVGVMVWEFVQHHPSFPFTPMVVFYLAILGLNHVFRIEHRGHDKWVSR